MGSYEELQRALEHEHVYTRLEMGLFHFEATEEERDALVVATCLLAWEDRNNILFFVVDRAKTRLGIEV